MTWFGKNPALSSEILEELGRLWQKERFLPRRHQAAQANLSGRT